jgi:hypothetical protein
MIDVMYKKIFPELVVFVACLWPCLEEAHLQHIRCWFDSAIRLTSMEDHAVRQWLNNRREELPTSIQMRW